MILLCIDRPFTSTVSIERFQPDNSNARNARNGQTGSRPLAQKIGLRRRQEPPDPDDQEEVEMGRKNPTSERKNIPTTSNSFPSRELSWWLLIFKFPPYVGYPHQ